MTLIWLIAWLIFDQVGDRAPLRFDPVNLWAGLLIAAVAVDLARQHTPRRDGKRGR